MLPLLRIVDEDILHMNINDGSVQNCYNYQLIEWIISMDLFRVFESCRLR